MSTNENLDQNVQLIEIGVRKQNILEFYDPENLSWAANPMNPLDVSSFCDIIIPENSQWGSFSDIIALKPSNSYQFFFKLYEGLIPPFSIAAEAQQGFSIVIEQISPELGFILWEEIFNNPVATNGATLSLDIGADNKTPILHASQELRNGIMFQYTVLFQFTTPNNNVTRYCRIDPLIRSNSEDDGENNPAH